MSKKLKFSPKGFLDYFGKTIFNIANEQNHNIELTGYKFLKNSTVSESFIFPICTTVFTETRQMT